MIETMFGNYEERDEIEVIFYGINNEKFTKRGFVIGKRVALGREYLILESEERKLFDVSLIDASNILKVGVLNRVARMEQEVSNSNAKYSRIIR